MNRGTGGDVGAIVNHSNGWSHCVLFSLLMRFSEHVIAAFLDWRASSQIECRPITRSLLWPPGLHGWRHLLRAELRTRLFVCFSAHDHRDDGALYVCPKISWSKTYLAVPSIRAVAALDCSSICGSWVNPSHCLVHLGQNSKSGSYDRCRVHIGRDRLHVSSFRTCRAIFTPHTQDSSRGNTSPGCPILRYVLRRRGNIC
jgi:hypothetical protein